ncbi:N-acetylglucosaminylphosphatidylinositol deacetylase [Angomonas deanei]|nr:N-acetylglucosaminylphosphatidylinositol deacetylase [Angomonas deanei]EPY41860.1 N-acetylglucosaminylphosphatidylinositol deacetylase [Angomonas deanei]|eukprot:EPY38020.1 N-acetylglucosaminylphosphatidylinositol deacetylase [Angomonas deanei]
MKVVNHAELQDGMKNVWPKSVIKHIVNEYLDRIGSIRTIVTFDKHGVSSHPNHIAVHNGVKEVKESMPPGLLFVELITRSIVGKYCGCLSLTNYCLFANTTEYNGSRFSLSIPPYATLSSFRAMERHQSQLRWFRYLFVLFSSYTYINEFQPIS